MQIFHSRKAAYVVIIGCGRLGARLAGTLSDHGVDVLILDQNADTFRKLPLTYGGMTQTGDAQSYAVLREANIEKADCAIVVTDHDNANAMIAQIAKEVFHVPHVITRLYDPDQAGMYQSLGIDTICPADLAVRAIFDQLKATWNQPEGRKEGRS